MRALLLAAFALVASGCFNPDDIFPVAGVVRSVDGVEGQVVALLRQPTAGTCDQETLAVPFKQATTDGGGDYGFEVFRAQSQSLTTMGSFCFRVTTTFDGSGSQAYSDLNRITQQLTLPPLRDWHANVVLDGGVLQFDPAIAYPDDVSLDGGPLTTLDHRAELLTDTGTIIWRTDDWFPNPDGGVNLREPMVFDELRLEDFVAKVHLSARLVEPDPPTLDIAARTTSTTNLRAGQLVPLTGIRVPLSRGLPCPELATPCPLTDGDAAYFTLSTTTLTLVLPTPAPLTAIVLRGVETASPVVGLVLTQDDGGVQHLSHQLPLSVEDLRAAGGGGGGPPRRRDGGVPTMTLPAITTWSVVRLDGGANISRVELGFPEPVTKVGEISLFQVSP
jgi:hypothetical protein